MTREGQEPRPDDSIAPPASTRWSEETPSGDEGLVAPFIPGQTRARSAQEPPTPAEPGTAPEPQPTPEAEGTPEPDAAREPEAEPESYVPYVGGEPTGATASAEPEPADAVEDPFPFDMPWSDEPEPSAASPETETPDEPFADGSAPWEPDAGEAGPEAVAAEEYGEPEEGGSTVADDDFPMEVFDIDPATAPAALPGAESGFAGKPVSAAADEVAGKLELLASQLRAEGVDGIERELASSDRLTSLLAALLAGHLSGR